MHFSFPPLHTVTNATKAVWDATNDRVSIAAGRPFTDNSNWHIFTGGAVGPGCRIIDSANSNIFSPLYPFLANLYSAVKTKHKSDKPRWMLALLRSPSSLRLGRQMLSPRRSLRQNLPRKFKIMMKKKAMSNLWSLMMRMWLARPESLGIGSCLANGIQLRRRPMLRVRLSLSWRKKMTANVCSCCS